MDKKTNKILIFIVIALVIFGIYYYYIRPQSFGALGNIYSAFKFSDPNIGSSGVAAYFPGSPDYGSVSYSNSSTNYVTCYDSISAPSVRTPLTITKTPYTYFEGGEMGLLNAFFQKESLAKMFMSNDTPLVPIPTSYVIEPTSSTSITTLNVFTGNLTPASVNGVATFAGMPFYVNGSKTPSGTISSNQEKISLNQVMGIPGDVFFNGSWVGTPASTLKTVGQVSLSDYQILRQNLIAGILNSIHTVFCNAPQTAGSSGVTVNTADSTSITVNGVPGSLYNLLSTNYDIDATPEYDTVYPNAYDSTPNIMRTTSSGSSSGVQYPNGRTAATLTGSSEQALQLTANVKHVIWLYVIARESWIANCINNIQYL